MKEHGICITYEYDGDEAAWEQTCGAFLRAIEADRNVSGKFSYEINRGKDGRTRVHIGRWDSAQTLASVQSTDYFKAFAASVKSFGGDSLRTRPFASWGRTGEGPG